MCKYVSLTNFMDNNMLLSILVLRFYGRARKKILYSFSGIEFAQKNSDRKEQIKGVADPRDDLVIGSNLRILYKNNIIFSKVS